MKRARILTVGTALSAVLMTVGAAAPASSNTTTGAGYATSKAAEVDNGSGYQVSNPPTVKLLSGLLGLTLSGLTSGVVTNVVNPLLALPQQLTTGLASSLTGAGLTATNPTTSQPRPAAGSYPTCGQQGWTAQDCFGPTVAPVSVPSVVTLSTGALQGYATGDSQGYIAAAKVANPSITLLGVNIGNLGVIQSSAQCGTSGSCTASRNVTGGSLFGGALTYSVANGSVLAQVGNQTVGSIPVTVTSAVKATVDQNLLKLSITLSLDQVLGALGTTLNALGGLLGGTLVDASSTATLTVTIGPGATSATSPVSAWGLEVGVDLNTDIKLNLVGVNLLGLQITVATIEVKAGPAGTAPDLLDLKLAYSEAGAGTLLPSWVPPGLI